MFFIRLYRVIPMLVVLAVTAALIYGVASLMTSKPRAKEIVLTFFTWINGILSGFFLLATLYALFEQNTNSFDLMGCFFITALIGLIITRICHAVFVHHYPSFKNKAERAETKPTVREIIAKVGEFLKKLLADKYHV